MREEITNKTLQLSKQYTNVILEFATGVGKTKIALDSINEYPGKWYLILAETSHINNWKDEFDKWGYSHLLDRVEIVLYHSLHKLQDTEVEGIVYDESHHLFSELRLSYSKTIKRNRVIFLSATLKTEQLSILGLSNPMKRKEYDINEFNVNLTRFDGVVFSIFLDQAIHWGILVEPKITLIPIQLEECLMTSITIKKGKGEINLTDTLANKWKYLRKDSKHKNCTVKLSCTQTERYEELESTLEYYATRYFKSLKQYQERSISKDQLDRIKNMWLRKGLDRKNYLASIKIPYIKRLLTKIKDKRLICFANSIKEIEELGGENAVHSKKKKLNTRIIGEFNASKRNSLFAVGMLVEGVNLNNIEVGIITQLDGQVLSTIQKLGRILRSSTPEQYIMYIEDTRDEDYISIMKEELDESYFTIKTLDEL